ncbi:MAG: dipeptidase [Microbacteriaceae bacterium]|nr:dipeptidase [Microbacteriaceae bacterium]
MTSALPAPQLRATEPTPTPVLEELTRSVAARFPATVADLCRLVRIPSVSWDAFDEQHVLRSADAVAKIAAELGVFDRVEISRAHQAGSEVMGQPAVLATRAARNGKPTVMLYAHHDVQPPGDEAAWDSPPFEPTVRGERLYGRGAADDKAGVMTHFASIRTLMDAAGADFDLGLVLFIEGEEEFGSRSFGNFLEQHRAAMQADAIVVADSLNWNLVTPALTVALRGNVTFRLTVSTLDHPSHSGMFGGAVPDAMLATIALLATLHTPDGSVAVPGLTSTPSGTPEYSVDTLREESGLLAGVTPIGTGTILSRLWFQPAITVTGIDAPSVANASNTLAAAVTVRISARVAPGQTASSAWAAIEQHLIQNAPFGAHLKFDDVDLGNPFLVDTGGPAVAEAKQSMRDAWGVDAVETGIGGSIPFISTLVDVFPQAEILVTGVEDPDSRAHSPNESLHLGVFQRSILTEAVLLTRLNGASSHNR